IEPRLLLAESRLRAGALDEALVEFERVLKSPDPHQRALALGRIASVYDARFDSNRASAAIEAAFAELGEAPPDEKPSYAVEVIGSWAKRKVPAGLEPRLMAN